MVEKKDLEIGKVLYYIKKSGVKWEVGYGLVDDYYPTVIVLNLYEPYDRRQINGTPIKDFVTPTKWKKLPKGWSYDTKLFELDYGNYPTEFKFREWLDYPLDVTRPESIQKAIEQQILVKVSENDHCDIETEIDSSKGWRLIRKYKSEYRPSYLSVYSYDVFETYKEAECVVKAHEAELKRQSELSDYDWSVEQIDKSLDLWANLCSASDVEKRTYRDWLLKLDKVEDVETRVCGMEVQWKYCKNSRWMSIAL